MFQIKSKLFFLCFAFLLLIPFLLLETGCNKNNGSSSNEAVGRNAPLSSMVAVRLTDNSGTGASNTADYVKALVELFTQDNLPGGVEFPLANTTDDKVRQITGLEHNVVVKWLDPLTLDESGEGLRYGSNNDFLAYFDEGWDSDWVGSVVGSAPQFNGSSTSAWIWSNHEYISNDQPTTTTAPTGQHLTLARFLRFFDILTNDVEDDIWDQADVDTYIRQFKRQLGGSWFRILKDSTTGEWMVDRNANNLRYDSTSNTLFRVTGHTISSQDQDDNGSPLPVGVIAGIQGDCSGGQTPWGTVITAEENVQDYYGDFETAWTSNQQFIVGQGFDPGSNISPTFEASTSSQFGMISDPNGRHNRDFYGLLAEIDAGVGSNLFYTSINDGGNGIGHRKIGAVGRARWENATFAVDANFRLINGEQIVIYAGDDRRSGRIYKWVSREPFEQGMTKAEVRALLDEGTLFVAHFIGLDNTTGITLLSTGQPPTEDNPGTGQWIEISTTSTDVAPNAAALGVPGTTVGDALKNINWNGIGGFQTDNDVRLASFTASNKIGIFELNRPEDIEWNPNDPSGTPRLYVTFTNNGRQVALDQNGVLFPPDQQEGLSPTRPDPFGSIFAIQEEDPENPAESESLLYFNVWLGTEGTGPFDAANPDNLALDKDGGVWFGTDGNFGRNGTADGLYYLDLDPSNKAGQPGIITPTFGLAFRVVAAPSDSEATGPAFNSNMDTIFFNVQHPGEEDAPSTWPQNR